MAPGTYNLYLHKKRDGLYDTNLITKTPKKRDANGVQHIEEPTRCNTEKGTAQLTR